MQIAVHIRQNNFGNMGLKSPRIACKHKRLFDRLGKKRLYMPKVTIHCIQGIMPNKLRPGNTGNSIFLGIYLTMGPQDSWSWLNSFVSFNLFRSNFSPHVVGCSWAICSPGALMVVLVTQQTAFANWFWFLLWSEYRSRRELHYKIA